MSTVRTERKLAKQCCLLLHVFAKSTCPQLFQGCYPPDQSLYSRYSSLFCQHVSTIYPVESIIQPLNNWNLKDNRRNGLHLSQKYARGHSLEVPLLLLFCPRRLGKARYFISSNVHTSTKETMQIYFIACVLLFCTKITYKMYLKSIFTVMGVKITT